MHMKGNHQGHYIQDQFSIIMMPKINAKSKTLKIQLKKRLGGVIKIIMYKINSAL